MKKTKLVSLFLALALSAGVFSGCAGKTTSSGAPSASSGEAATASSGATGETVNITFLADTNQKNADKVLAAMNEYTKDKIGVTLTFDHSENKQVVLASSSDLDLVWLAPWDGAVDLGRKNAIQDITDLLPNYPGLVNMMPAKFWEASKIDGRNYVVPVYKEAFTGVSLIMPKQLVDRVKDEKGFDVTTVKLDTTADWTKLEPYLAAVKEMGVEYVTGFARVSYALQLNPNYEDVNGYYAVDTTTNKIIDRRFTPEYKAFLQMMYDWNQKGYIPDEVAVDGMGDINDNALKENNLGLSDWWNTPDNQKNADGRYSNEMVLIPTMKNYTMSDSVNASSYGINARSKKTDACLKFLELLNTDEKLADMYVYGIEGEDYTRADNIVTVNANAGWSMPLWKACSVMAPSLSSADSADKKEQYQADNEAAVSIKSLGFIPSFDAISAEKSAVENAAKEGALLNTGFENPDEKLDEFLNKLTVAGNDKILAELQKQYDEWLKTKK